MHEITFNTKPSEAARTRADFTYKITPTLISISDTGLGSCPVTEDIEAVLRKIEFWHQGSIASSRSCAATAKGSGMECDGTAKPRLFLLYRKLTSDKSQRSYCRLVLAFRSYRLNKFP